MGQDAFNGCKNITSVTLPNNADIIAQSAFENCTSLVSVNIPRDVKYICASAFKNCTALSVVNFNATAMENEYDPVDLYDIFENAGTSGDGIIFNVGSNVTKIPPYLSASNSIEPKFKEINFESDSQCQKQKPENEIADAASDVALPYKECDVLTKRNLTIDDSRLPPRGRLNYFARRTDDCTDAGVGAAGDGAAGLDRAE